MSGARRRQANLLGALCLALDDRLREAAEGAAGRGSAAPAALVALHEFLGGRSMDDLRRAVGLTPSGAVRLVDRLVAAGQVGRRPGTDGRSVSLSLTPRGRRAARQVLAGRAAALEAAVAELTAGERAALARTAAKLLRTVTGQRLAARARGDPPAAGWLCRLCDFEACGRERGACPVANTVAAAGGGRATPEIADPASERPRRSDENRPPR